MHFSTCHGVGVGNEAHFGLNFGFAKVCFFIAGLGFGFVSFLVAGFGFGLDFNF